MKLSTGIIAIVLLFTFMELTNGTLYRTLNWHGKDEKLGYGCWKSKCWAYCGAYWTSGEWCFSSQVGESIAGFQTCRKDRDCTSKVMRCVSGCTL